MEIVQRRSPDGLTIEIFIPRELEQGLDPIGTLNMVMNGLYDLYHGEELNG